MNRVFRLALPAVIVVCMCVCNNRSIADEVAFDDFENTTLVPFTVASGTTSEPAYFGWTAMDVDSWFAEQGDQGRDTCGCLGTTTNNTAMIADPDAWDDFTAGTIGTGYNSFVSRTYDLTGFDFSSVQIDMVYEFRAEDSQVGTIEVSFDGGTTWQLLERFDTATLGDGNYADSNGGTSGTDGQGTYNAGVEFNATSSEMILRFGMIESGNDWWFAFDDIRVTTGDGFNEFEDFEGLPLEPFVEAGDGDGTDWTNDIRTGTALEWVIDNTEMVPGILGDGMETDWTRDIPNWVVDNSANLGFSFEGGYDGWAAMDVASWESEQGGQGRTLFNIVDPFNTAMVADGDAFYDYDSNFDMTDGAPDKALNTYARRTYDLSAFDSTTLCIQFEYEFRVENAQQGVVEVSLDGGATFTRLLELDNMTVLGQDKMGNDIIAQNGDVLANLAVFKAGQDFPADAANTLILQFGYLCADNNWWFAFDNVLVEADAAKFVLGDVNCDGEVSLLDVQPFVDLVLTGTFVTKADINMDGTVDLLDVAPFVNLLTGG